ncbi:MAG: cytochrome c oxidase assembly protein, partial [Actinomycetes bacterium]
MAHLGDFVTGWQLSLLPAVLLVASAVLYLAGAATVSRRHPTRPWPARHTVAFFVGLTMVVLVTLGPVGTYDDTFFWAHMTQHIVLMMLAAPLLLLGEPVLLVLRISSRDVRRRWVIPVLHSRLLRFLTHPVVSWLIFASVIVGAHFTHFYEYALEHDSVHTYIEHPIYLTAGLLYYYPLLGSSPGPSSMSPFSKVVSQFLMMVPETMTGFAIYMASAVLYPY